MGIKIESIEEEVITVSTVTKKQVTLNVQQIKDLIMQHIRNEGYGTKSIEFTIKEESDPDCGYNGEMHCPSISVLSGAVVTLRE
jgi:hypothetical protein